MPCQAPTFEIRTVLRALCVTSRITSFKFGIMLFSMGSKLLPRMSSQASNSSAAESVVIASTFVSNDVVSPWTFSTSAMWSAVPPDTQ